MMTKYIVKNCPALLKMVTINSKKGHETLFDSCSEGKHCLCKDRTDCPIKQVIKLMTETCSISDLLNAEELRLTDRGILAKQILQTLQVEEEE